VPTVINEKTEESSGGSKSFDSCQRNPLYKLDVPP